VLVCIVLYDCAQVEQMFVLPDSGGNEAERYVMYASVHYSNTLSCMQHVCT
jgi:hypothetical protein